MCECVRGLRGLSAKEWKPGCVSVCLWIVTLATRLRHDGTMVFFNWKRSFDAVLFLCVRFDAILDLVMVFFY